MKPVSPGSSLSSSNPFAVISPKPRHHQPEGNVLATSPNTFASYNNARPVLQESEEEWSVQELEDDDEDERASVATEMAARSKGPLIVYDRIELLKLSKKDTALQNMPTLESWFGPWSPTKITATTNYQEGDGYQRRDNVNGRGIGNSGRPRNNIGLRRNPDEAAAPQPIHHDHDAPHNRRRDRHDHTPADNFRNPFAPSQMGRFGVGKSNLKLGGDEADKAREEEGSKRDRAPHLAGGRTRDGQHDRRAGPSHAQDGGDRRRDEAEWRRGTGAGQGSKQAPANNRRQGNNRWQQAHDDDAHEPAWMDDAPKASEKAKAVDEPLIKFVPGEDMIAAHKRAMKARAEPATTAGFFGDPAIAATSAPPAPAVKVFNPADYLLPEKEMSARPSEPEKSTSGSSRFQRFFGGAQSAEPSPDPTPASKSQSVQQTQSLDSKKDTDPMKLDDHMAKLLGMLDPKAASPVPSSRSSVHQAPRHEQSPLPHQQQPSSFGSYHQPPGLGSAPRNQQSSPLPPYLYANDTGSSRYSPMAAPVAPSDPSFQSPPVESRLHSRMGPQPPQPQPPQGVYMQQQQQAQQQLLQQRLQGSEANGFDPRPHINSPSSVQQASPDPMQALFAQAQAQQQRQQILQRSVNMQQHLATAQPPPHFARPPPGMFPGPGPGAPDLLRDLQQQQQRGYGPGPGGFPPPPPHGHFPPPQQYGFAQPPPPPSGMGRPMYGMMPAPPAGGPPGVSGYPQQDAMAALFAGLNRGS